MKIAIKNLKKSSHTICTLAGQRIVIKPKDYTLIVTDDERDIMFWTNLTKSSLNRYGLNIITDEAEIYKLECNKNNGSYDTSIVDGFVSPISRDIASVTSKKPDITVKEDSKENIVPENKSNSEKYAEDKLSQMDKDDLFNLCDNFNIKYKKNNSVKTLVRLLIEAGVLE